MWIESNLTQIFDSLQIKEIFENSNLTIRTTAVNEELSGFIRNFIIGYLKPAGLNNDNESKRIMHIEQFETGIVYLQNSGGFLYLQTEVSRFNHILLKGWIEEQNEIILKPIEIHKTFSERDFTEDLSDAELSPYSFTKGKTKENSFWAEVVEPVLVVSTLSVMVYLFFSVRS